MFRLLQYYGQWQGFRGRVIQLPAWARLLLMLAALPGIVLVALSILAFLVSVLALLLLAVPAYRVMKAVTGAGHEDASTGGVIVEGGAYDSPGRKRVEATVIDPAGVTEGPRATTE